MDARVTQRNQGGREGGELTCSIPRINPSNRGKASAGSPRGQIRRSAVVVDIATGWMLGVEFVIELREFWWLLVVTGSATGGMPEAGRSYRGRRTRECPIKKDTQERDDEIRWGGR